MRLKCETADISSPTTDLVSLNNFGVYSLCEILPARRNIIPRLRHIYQASKSIVIYNEEWMAIISGTFLWTA